MTLLDEAHARMAAAPEDPLPRLSFYEMIAAGELVVLLEAEPAPGAGAVPALFPTAEGTLALAFDAEGRLADFTGGAAPYAALPGRALIGLLAERGLGLGLNLSVAPSEFLMPPAAVSWLAGVLAAAPAEMRAVPAALHPPRAPEALLVALDRRLARAGGLAAHALLAFGEWPGGQTAHLLVFVGALPGAEAALAQAAGEALAFCGLDGPGGTTLDVAFLAPDDPAVRRLSRLALRIDLPAPARKSPPPPAPPGMDPQRPPRLR